MQLVLFGDTREGDEVGGRVKNVRQKRCEVLQSCCLELACFEICIPQTILENLDLSILRFCDGQNLVLQDWQGNSPPGTLQHSKDLERWGKSFLK